MKKITISSILILFTYLVSAQVPIEHNSTMDSLALNSRHKADVVLSYFNTLSGKKLLYSIDNIGYYIIVEQQNGYKEYAIHIDSTCNILSIKDVGYQKDLEFKKLKSKIILLKKNKKRLKKLIEDQETIKRAFDISQYGKDLKTTVPNSVVLGDSWSYFVIKDNYGNRYGEYHLYTLTSSIPIDPKLLMYLIKGVLMLDMF